MASLRDYGAGVVPSRSALAQGPCYWPGCLEPTTRFVDGIPVNNFEVAHIRAISSGGPRAVEEMSEKELNHFDNLILLCLPHHKVVDKIRPRDFSIETLEAWKADKEGPGVSALRGLRGVTEDQLQTLIADSFVQVTDDIHEAVNRLAAIDAEAAALLSPLVDQLAEAQFHRYFPSEDVASILDTASRKLEHLQDTAPKLQKAVGHLDVIHARTDSLLSAVQSLRGATDALNAVAARIERNLGMM